jgi:hypothetical protein
MRTQNSEVRIQNEGSGTLFRILTSVFCILRSEFKIRKNALVPSFWILNSEFWIPLCLFPTLLFPEIIDRIVITVGNQVITQSQINDEIRVTAFLNRAKVDLSADAKKDAANRLIEQALIKREMELSRYPLPELSDAGESLQTLKAMYPSETDFQNALQTYEITADELTRRLWWQLTLLRFIDYRFRPGIQIPTPDVQAYYRQQVSEWEQ